MMHNYFPDILNLENLIEVPKTDLPFIKSEDKYDPKVHSWTAKRVISSVPCRHPEETRGNIISSIQKSAVALFKNVESRMKESDLDYQLIWINEFENWLYDGTFIQGPLKIIDVTFDYMIKFDNGDFQIQVKLNHFFLNEGKIFDLDGKCLEQP